MDSYGARPAKIIRKQYLYALALTLASALCLPTPALSQNASISRLTPINTPTVFYFHSRVVNCQGVAPWHLARRATVVAPERPAHGSLAIREGQAPVQHCQGRIGYATIVTYTPDRDFAGIDNFKLRILFELENRLVSRPLAVRVQVGGPGNPH